MGDGRLEAIRDGVLAFVMTIMLLELKTLEGESLGDLMAPGPVFLNYILTLAYVGIHLMSHPLLQTMSHGSVLPKAACRTSRELFKGAATWWTLR